MMSNCERTGWLLDVYEDPTGGVVVWFLDETGERLRLLQPFPVVFYALGQAERLDNLAILLSQPSFGVRTWRDTRADVFKRSDVPVLAVEVRRPAEVLPLFWRLYKQFTDLEYADVDLPIALRYAAATDVSLLCRCRIQMADMETIRTATALESPWDLDPSDIPWRVMKLEPDSNPAHRSPRYLLVQAGDQRYRFSLQPQRALIANLQALLTSYDPDLLVTAWGDTWLLPLLKSMAEQNNLPFALNRDRSTQVLSRKERWYFSYGRVVYRGAQIHLQGRWHIDRKNTMLWSEYQLGGVLEMARVTGLPLQTAARVSPGTGISAIQMATALHHRILVPWQKQQAEMLKPAADLFAADQGGLVFQPITGLHRNVAGIDFVSMFPSEMVFFNLSPETIGVQGPQSEQVPGLHLTVDQSREGIIPLALRPLLTKRVALKRRKSVLPRWDPRRKTDVYRSTALKWLLVTCFGYLGYKNARFGRIEAHQAVTAYAREALILAKEAAEDAGFELVHAYVDGLWIKYPDEGEPAGLDALLEEIEKRTRLPIALDGIYRWVAFLPSRVDANRSVANRYFGVFRDGEMKVRGVAARRRDTPAWIAAVQLELIELLARCARPEDGLPGAMQHLARQQTALNAGRVPLEQLLVSQRLSRELADYRTPSPAARAARQLQQAGKQVQPGQSVRFLYTLGEPGVYAWDLPEPPNPVTLDRKRYQTLLLRAAQEVLDPFAPPGALWQPQRKLL